MTNPGGSTLLFQLRLALNSETGERDRFESCTRDRFPGHFALSIGAKLNALEGLIDFVKRVLLLRKQTQRKIAIVCV